MAVFHVAAKHILVDIHRCTSSPTETSASFLWHSSDGYWMLTVGKPGRLGKEEPVGGTSHLSRTSLQGHLGSRASEFMFSGRTLISLWETLNSLLWITRSHDSSYWHLTWRCDQGKNRWGGTMEGIRMLQLFLHERFPSPELHVCTQWVSERAFYFRETMYHYP